MKKYIVFILSTFISFQAFSQGCIAVRSMSVANGNPNATSFLHKGQFQFSMNYRSLHSYKHFVGTEEQPQRVEQGTEVINDSHNFDFGLTYAVTDRLNVTLNVPISYNDRSSLYEHYGNGTPAGSNPRFHTYSKGVNDMRLSANYWIIDPSKHPKGNLGIGVGIKAPTGNSNVQDDFHKLDKNGKEYIQRKAVDQSMQLGDGGWGYSIEAQGYYMLNTKTSVYYNAFYLFSPRELNVTTNFSVPDQYGARVGLAYSLFPKQNIAAILGGRVEGLPNVDAIGGSDGSRRPGYIVSVEPGLIWVGAKNSLMLTVPVALVRNRTPTWTPLGFRSGDAAFADYFISATYSHRF
jgi:hypothetical protein